MIASIPMVCPRCGGEAVSDCFGRRCTRCNWPGPAYPSEGGRSATFINQKDAPDCPDCGAPMVRNGSTYRCLNCGEGND